MQSQSKYFLQSEFWADFKSRHGWKKFLFSFSGEEVFPVDSFEKNTSAEKTLSVLVRSFNLKIKKISIAYIPMAPEIQDSKDKARSALENMERISEKISAFLPENTICIRFDPPIDFESIDERSSFISAAKKISCGEKKFSRIKKSSADIQPPDTVLLALEGTEEEILCAMKSKWRYNIRLADKKGVKVKTYRASDSEFSKAFNEFYSLFMQTSQRDGVQFHKKEYYIDLLNLSAASSGAPQVQLYLAEHEGDVLAGIITLFSQNEAVYLYGASGNIKRNLMPAYLLQWTAICDAKTKGCLVYDFYGCPPTDDKNHPMHGLFLFKTGFGGKLIHRPGSFDFVLKKNWYAFYTLAEKLRSWFFKKLKKRFAGR
ncbi:lipid II:glycine glycyltransferase FemX [Treponema sp.]|uniref:lipid II:glycine glycyltransferase FemX n=1 Tax=Treponema sp. TaxID=166 RepID=UPI003F066B16